MKKTVALLLGAFLSFFPLIALAAPSFADTRNITGQHIAPAGTSFSATYTVPSGTNQVFVIFFSGDITGASGITAITLNGVSMSLVSNQTVGQCDNSHASNEGYATLVAPTTGTLSITKGSGGGIDLGYFTVNSADQTSPVDKAFCRGNTSLSTITATVTPATTNTLLVDWMALGSVVGSSHGSGQTEYINFDDRVCCLAIYGSTVNGSSTASTVQGMTENYTGGSNVDLQILAIKAFVASAVRSRPQRVINF